MLPAKHSYHFTAKFIEGCSCKDVCVTEITGRDAGCHGLGALQFSKGSYDGKDISGTSASFAWDSGKWVDLVIDAPAGKRDAVTNLMKAFLADWGKLEPVRSGSVRIWTASSSFNLAVNKGKSMSLAVKPVFGGDGKTAVVHANLTSPMHSTLMQGLATSAQFGSGHPFTLKGTNAFYNMHCVMKGKI
jgi:hypothetical protein